MPNERIESVVGCELPCHKRYQQRGNALLGQHIERYAQAGRRHAASDSKRIGACVRVSRMKPRVRKRGRVGIGV